MHIRVKIVGVDGVGPLLHGRSAKLADIEIWADGDHVDEALLLSAVAHAALVYLRYNAGKMFVECFLMLRSYEVSRKCHEDINKKESNDGSEQKTIISSGKAPGREKGVYKRPVKSCFL